MIQDIETKELADNVICHSSDILYGHKSSKESPFEMKIVFYARPIGKDYKRDLSEEVKERFSSECNRMLSHIHDVFLHKYGLLNN